MIAKNLTMLSCLFSFATLITGSLHSISLQQNEVKSIIVGNYKCISLVGEGAYASAFLAEKIRTQEKVVIKKNRDSNTNESEILELLNLLNSENIVKYFESFSVNNNVHVVMEFIDGKNLQEVMENRNDPLDEADIAYICKSILDALVQIHSAGVIHMDIKLSNTMIDREGTIKLIDFGLSLRHNIDKVSYVKIGTCEYLSPEIVMSSPFDYKTDIWSLGILALKLAFRKPLYKGRAQKFFIMNFRDMKKPPELEYVKRKLSPEFLNFLNTCLSVTPGKRTSAFELLSHSFIQGAKGPSEDLMNSTKNMRKALCAGDIEFLYDYDATTTVGNLVGQCNTKIRFGFLVDGIFDDDFQPIDMKSLVIDHLGKKFNISGKPIDNDTILLISKNQIPVHLKLSELPKVRKEKSSLIRRQLRKKWKISSSYDIQYSKLNYKSGEFEFFKSMRKAKPGIYAVELINNSLF